MDELFQRFSETARQHCVKTAVVFDHGSCSYMELLGIAKQWAQRFESVLEADVRPRVALLTEHPLHTIGASVGVAKLGGACIPTNPQMLSTQLLSGWHATDVNVVVYEPRFENKISAVTSLLSGDDEIVFVSADSIEDAVAADVGLEDVEETNRPTNRWPEKNDFLITLSSGSTGAPKPIVISQRVKVARARQTWDLYGLTHEDVVLCASPYFHSLGQRLVYVPLLLGSTLVFLEHFKPLLWLDVVAQHRVSFVIAVSSHLYALKDELLHRAEQLKSLKTIVTSSAPIDAAFKEELFSKVGCDFHEIYGATEIAVATNLAPEDAATKYATVGIPCDGIAVRVVDDEGTDSPLNAIGEIVVKTPLAYEGYYNAPQLTENAQLGEYFRTGDLGTVDEDGFLSYVGRKKDVIITGGMNIYPKDIEAVLSIHEQVSEVAVIGVEDDLLGEVVIAVCVSCETKNLVRELRAMANKQLASFQRPLKYFFVENLPLTPSGKVSKKELRSHYNEKNDGWTHPLRLMLYGRA